MKKEQKRKERRLTTQCIGIVLIVFALGMFIGYACNYQDVIANFFTGQSVDRTHIIHNSSKMAEQGIRVGYYVLGTTENEKYDIKFDDKVKKEEDTYVIDGTFTNNNDQHFTTVELNFSLLDENHNKIGDAYAYCDRLSPGQKWIFKAANTKDYKLPSQPTYAILDNVIYTFS